jgi:hypothetical protein
MLTTPKVGEMAVQHHWQEIGELKREVSVTCIVLGNNIRVVIMTKQLIYARTAIEFEKASPPRIIDKVNNTSDLKHIQHNFPNAQSPLR